MPIKQKTLFAYLVLALLPTVLGTRNQAQAESASWKVGVLLCLTGGCAEPGNNALNGIKLAAEEINHSGGVLGRKIELVVEDTREAESAANSVAGYQKLALDKDIQYIIGPTWTIGGLGIAPIVAKRKDLIMVSPSLGVADFNEAGDHLFNIWPHDSYSTEGLAAYAMNHGWKTAAVLSNQGPWESVQAKVFADAFKKLGGQVVAYEEPLASVMDLKAEALRIKSKNPQVVFMSNYTQMDSAARDLRNMHFNGQIMSILMDETRIKNADGALEGALFARYADATKSFAENYERAFQQKPGIASDTGYDALKLFASAVEGAKSFDVSVVKKTISSTKLAGAGGEIVFDGKGGVVKHPEFWVVKNGKQEFLAKEP